MTLLCDNRSMCELLARLARQLLVAASCMAPAMAATPGADGLLAPEFGYTGTDQAAFRLKAHGSASKVEVELATGQMKAACDDAAEFLSGQADNRAGWDLFSVPIWWSLAKCNEALGRHTPAKLALRRLLDIGERQTTLARAFYTDGDLERLSAYLNAAADLCYAYTVKNPDDPEGFSLASLASFRRTNRLADELAVRAQVFARTRSPAYSALLQAQHHLSEVVLNKVFETFWTRLLPFHSDELATAAAAVDLAEKPLLGATASTQLLNAPFFNLTDADPDLALTLDVNFQTAYIQYVRYQDYDFGAEDKPAGTRKPRYLALLRLVDRKVIVPLGEADSIEAAAHKVAEAEADPGSSAADASRVGYETFVAPVFAYADLPHRPFLNRLHIIPDGFLALVPFNALRGPDGYLIDRFTVVMHDSMRDTLSLYRPTPAGGPRQNAVIVGGVNYSKSFVGLNSTVHPAQLPTTIPEIKAVAEVFAAEPPLTEDRATAARVEAVKGPSILHLATHGMFLPAVAKRGAEPSAINLPSASASIEEPTGVEDQAMTRAILVLAGDDGKPGLLTALDLATMDLNGTRLAVFSACDTEKGDYAYGEGIIGLRLAARLAGARTTVTSLWATASLQTADMISAFYAKLGRGQSIAGALREAALEERARDPRPAIWAAFVTYGGDSEAPMGDIKRAGKVPPSSQELFALVKKRNELIRRSWPFTGFPPPEPELTGINGASCDLLAGGDAWECAYDAVYNGDSGPSRTRKSDLVLQDGTEWRLQDK